MILEKILKEQNIEEEQFDLGLQAIAQNPQARDVLWVLFIYTGFFGTSDAISGGSHASYISGRRSVAEFMLDIFDEVEDDILALMRADARQRNFQKKEKENAERNDRDNGDLYGGNDFDGFDDIRPGRNDYDPL